MPKKKREYWDYLRDIQQSLLDITEFVGLMSFEEFKADRKTVYAVVRALEITGEAVKKIPAQIRKQYTNVPWKDIAGMRDILIHEYFGVDLNTLWRTVQDDIPAVKPLIDDVFRGSTQKKLINNNV